MPQNLLAKLNEDHSFSGIALEFHELLLQIKAENDLHHFLDQEEWADLSDEVHRRTSARGLKSAGMHEMTEREFQIYFKVAEAFEAGVTSPNYRRFLNLLGVPDEIFDEIFVPVNERVEAFVDQIRRWQRENRKLGKELSELRLSLSRADRLMTPDEKDLVKKIFEKRTDKSELGVFEAQVAIGRWLGSFRAKDLQFVESHKTPFRRGLRKLIWGAGITLVGASLLYGTRALGTEPMNCGNIIEQLLIK